MGELQKRIKEKVREITRVSMGSLIEVELLEIVEEMRKEFEEASKLPSVFHGHAKFLELIEKWLRENK